MNIHAIEKRFRELDGFRWARSVGAWQRHNNESALYWAKQITGAGDAE